MGVRLGESGNEVRGVGMRLGESGSEVSGGLVMRLGRVL